jgi:hypothetical protein
VKSGADRSINDLMPIAIRGFHRVQIDQGVPWSVAPFPGAFALPHVDALQALVVQAGAPLAHPGACKLGSGRTREVAAAVVDGTGDVVIVGARVRHRIAGRKLEDTGLQEICAANDAEMKRNGHRLLEIVTLALRRASEDGCTDRLQAVVRAFPSVALRHERVAHALDRLRDPDQTVRRWFGLKAGRGRPARPVAGARAEVATLEHECDEAESVADALERLARTGMGSVESLRNRRSSEGELYQLSISGVWVKADRLLDRPWVGPSTAEMRWDVYRVSA